MTTLLERPATAGSAEPTRRRSAGRNRDRGIIVLAMPGQPQAVCHDHLRTVTLPGPRNRVARHPEAFPHVGAVHRVALHAVADRPVDQIVAGKLAMIRCGVGVLIVRHHHHDRQLFYGGKIQAFVKCAG